MEFWGFPFRRHFVWIVVCNYLSQSSSCLWHLLARHGFQYLLEACTSCLRLLWGCLHSARCRRGHAIVTSWRQPFSKCYPAGTVGRSSGRRHVVDSLRVSTHVTCCRVPSRRAEIRQEHGVVFRKAFAEQVTCSAVSWG